jgi:hypothetical protein
MSKDGHDKKGPVPPWLVGVKGVEGVTPPGRRLGPASEPRPNKWSASGVKGVTPPGTQRPGEGAAAAWATQKDPQRATAEKTNKRLYELRKQAAARPKEREPKSRPPRSAIPSASPGARDPDAFDPLRPLAGFLPDVFADVGDPGDIKGFLQSINDFLAEHRPHPECADGFAQVVTQSRAPFEIAVAFTVLTALVGKSEPLRRRYGAVLERGAKVYFNLASRLRADIKAPRGLVPETVDPLFYDLPGTAYQLPFAFATDAMVRLADLLRREGDDDYDRTIATFCRALYERFVGGRALGDQALARMFPWTPPPWMPEPEEA